MASGAVARWRDDYARRPSLGRAKRLHRAAPRGIARLIAIADVGYSPRVSTRRHSRMGLRPLVRLLMLCGLLLAARAHAQDVPGIAAASDLQFALEEIATLFRQDTGKNVRLAFGSSGNFRRQIAEGAPFELFLSADEAYVRALAKEGRTRDEGVVYAVGRIALIAATTSRLRVDPELDGLRKAIAAGEIARFAIANPEHAPYGRAAREALQHAGLWDAIQPKLVLGENVAQAAQFAATASVQGGIVSYSQARARPLASRTRHALIPEEWHQPLRQRMVLLAHAGATATAFYEFMQGPRARGVLARHGFAVPIAPPPAVSRPAAAH
jgi:molybdate transport system substrate-binding protein